MIIRRYDKIDFPNVVRLLINSGIEPPVEPSDLDGWGIVAEDKDKVVGFIWALIGQSTQAHICYLAASKTHPLLSYFLVKMMDKTLYWLGIKRYSFNMGDNRILTNCLAVSKN